jgi:hypothetical protein
MVKEHHQSDFDSRIWEGDGAEIERLVWAVIVVVAAMLEATEQLPALTA